jgi:hypothetical protein
MRLVILCALILAVGQSNRPAPTPAKNSQPQENHGQNGNSSSAVANQPANPAGSPPSQTIPPNGNLKPSDVAQECNAASSADGWLALFTLALVIVSILQFVTLKRQANSLEDSVGISKDAATSAKTSAIAASNTVNAMEQTAKRQLRAYVFIVKVERHSKFYYRHPNFVASISIKNGGATPAYGCTASVDIAIHPAGYDQDMPNIEHQSTDPMLVLHPDQSLEISTKSIRVVEQENEFIGGLKGIHVWGRIQYVDAFKEGHYTRFHLKCFGNIDFSDGKFVYCDKGNDAT